MELTKEYLDTTESFITIILEAYSNRNIEGNVRVYNKLRRKYYGNDSDNCENATFNTFMEQVLKYKTPYDYMMNQYNSGKTMARAFANGFHSIYEIYLKFNNNTKPLRTSTTFLGNFVYVTA